MKILLRKLSRSLLQGMYIDLVPKAAGPDVGGHDPPERTKKHVGIPQVLGRAGSHHSGARAAISCRGPVASSLLYECQSKHHFLTAVRSWQ